MPASSVAVTVAVPASSEWLSTRANPWRSGSEALANSHTAVPRPSILAGSARAASTVTVNVCETDSSSGSVAVTVIRAVPAPAPLTVSVPPSTATVATEVSEDVAS